SVLSTCCVRFRSGVTSTPSCDSRGWRLPFLARVIFIGIGLLVRMNVLESPTFKQVKQTGPVKLPVVEAIRRYWREILLIAFVRMAEQAPFYLFITFVLTYGTKELHLSKGTLLDYTLIAASLSLLSIPFFGWLSDRFGRRRVYAAGIVLTGAFA